MGALGGVKILRRGGSFGSPNRPSRIGPICILLCSALRTSYSENSSLYHRYKGSLGGGGKNERNNR